MTRLKAESGTHVDIGGPTFAATLVDLVDEFRMCVNPVAVGAGRPFFPAVAGQLDLRLVDCLEFPSGAVWLSTGERRSARTNPRTLATW